MRDYVRGILDNTVRVINGQSHLCCIPVGQMLFVNEENKLFCYADRLSDRDMIAKCEDDLPILPNIFKKKYVEKCNIKIS